MPNMDPKKCPMPVQDPDVRNKNFKEVALGYTYEMAVNEAKRCLNCKNKPCVSGCPVNIDIPAFIAKVADEDMEGAYAVLSASSALPAVCGRVCPQENQCEGKCVRGIKTESVGIGRLERFVADWHREHSTEKPAMPVPNGHRVAVIGSGPSGLTAAGDLAKLGYKVTVYEALHTAGGVLVYGIPEFRLPKDIVRQEIDGLKELGVDIETNVVIGKTITIDELFEMGNEAVFIGSGAGLPRFMGIPGESLKGVYSANEFLTRINLMKAYREGAKTPIQHARNVAVVGGGNVAMDAARCAKRLGAENVYIVYRRSMNELPARKEEVEHAVEEGIIFKTLSNPVEVLGDADGSVCGMRCVEMELGEPDASGRRRPVVKEGSEFVLEVDCMVMSIGTSPNPLIRSTTPGLETNSHGCIITNGDDGLTHVVFDWTQPNGKSVRLSRDDMAELQTIASEALGMERGVSSDRKHLSAMQYKTECAKEQLQELSNDISSALDKHKDVQNQLLQLQKELRSIETKKNVQKLISKASEKFYGLIGKTVNDREKDALKAKIKALEGENEQLSDRLGKAILEKERNGTKVFKAENDKEYYRQQMDNARTTSNRLRTENQELKTETKELKKELGKMKDLFNSEQLEALRHHFPNISKAMEEGKDLLKQITRSRGFGMGM